MVFHTFKQIKRSVKDRRSIFDRRTINLGPKYPMKEQRKSKERRHHWEKRMGWKPINRWCSTPFNLSQKKISPGRKKEFGKRFKNRINLVGTEEIKT